MVHGWLHTKEKSMKQASVVWVLVVLSLVSICSGRALAQETPNDGVIYTIYEQSGWHFYSVTAQGEFLGFWSIPLVETKVGNIRRLWFEYDTIADSWAVYAFEPQDKDAFMEDLISAGADSISFGFIQFAESEAVDDLGNGLVSGSIESGLVTGDVLIPLIESLSDPQAVLDVLADIGYPVAPMLSGAMSTGGVVGNMSQAFTESLDCLRSAGGSNCQWCTCTTNYGTPTPTPAGGPWTGAVVGGGGSFVDCEYTRPATAPYWLTGKKTYCPSCASGTAATPAGVAAGEEYVTVRRPVGSGCGTTPGGGLPSDVLPYPTGWRP